MPSKYAMTWEGGPRRWRKMHKGRMYLISAQQLGRPETKLDSYQAANDWWETKRLQIDGDRPPHPHDEVLYELQERLAWARRHHADDAAARVVKQIEAVERMADAPPAEVEEVLLDRQGVQERIDLARRHGVVVPEGVSPVVRDMIFGDRLVWEDRTQIDIDEPKVPADRTVADAVDRCLALKKAEADSGQIKTSSYQAVKDRLPHLRNYAGETEAARLDERTLSGFHGHLLARVGKGELSPQYAAHILSAAKTFTRWLWRERVLEHLPRNLDSLQITVGPREIPTFDLDVLGTILDHASERTRLFLLLMMNCGMYQIDVASLKKSQVDLEAGRISRKRSKTERHANVPVVSYLLWDETLRLLSKHGGEHPTLAVTNEKGEPLLRTPIRPDGQMARVDNIKNAYERVCRKLAFQITPLMYLRKTSATILESSDSFRSFTEDFLGHAPKTLAKARYARTDPGQFDRAVRWLGLQYGYVTTR